MEVELDSISKIYSIGRQRRVALSDVSFHAREGRILGIVGPNGAGKSTSTRILLGILQPDEGSVVVNGGTINPASEVFRHRCGFLPEERSLPRRVRAKDVLRYFGALKGLDRRTVDRRAGELFERFGISEYATSPTEKLSKGLCQRLQLCTCLINEPTLLVVDEPFSGLDVVAAANLREIFSSLRDAGSTLIICSHQMVELETLCDDILMLHKGSAVLRGPLRDIRLRYGDGELLVTGAPPLEALHTVAAAVSNRGTQRIRLLPGATLHDFLAEIAAQSVPLVGVDHLQPSLEEIFVHRLEEVCRESY